MLLSITAIGLIIGIAACCFVIGHCVADIKMLRRIRGDYDADVA